MVGSAKISRPWPGTLELGLRTVALSAALLWLAQRFGPQFVEYLLPCFKWEIGALDPDYAIKVIEIGHDGADTVVRVRAVVARAMVAGGRVFMPDPRGWIEVTTTVGTVLQPILIGLVMSGAWPAQRVAEFVLRMSLSIVVLAIILAIDTPLLLWGMVCDLFIQLTEPGRFSPAVMWSQFLSSGGRLGLGIVAGALAISGAEQIFRRSTRFWSGWGPEIRDANHQSEHVRAGGHLGDGQP